MYGEFVTPPGLVAGSPGARSILTLFAGHLLGPKDLQTFPNLHSHPWDAPVVPNRGAENKDPLWRDAHYTRQAAASLA